MITNPDLVVLDEPTSALDPTARAKIIDLLERIQAERNTATCSSRTTCRLSASSATGSRSCTSA